MNHLHVRCPSCAKLYQVDVAVIFSTSPHFECVTCATKFTFDFPPADPQNVKTHRLEAEPLAPAPIATRKCPKCGHESPKTADECYSCHVLFEKMEGLPANGDLKAQPSLVRRWKDVLEDYANEAKHQDFLMSCRDLEALGFAQHQYENLRRIQGRDEIADRMIARVNALRAVGPDENDESKVRGAKVAPPLKGAESVMEAGWGRFEEPYEDETSLAAPSTNSAPSKFRATGSTVGASAVPTEGARKRPKWMRFALMAPFLLSMIFVLWGAAHQGQRNLIGTGIAIALLSYGLITGLRGPLNLKDFKAD